MKTSPVQPGGDSTNPVKTAFSAVDNIQNQANNLQNTVAQLAGTAPSITTTTNLILAVQHGLGRA